MKVEGRRTPDESQGRGRIYAERFEILRELGSGGMGRVFLARDRRSGDKLALKFLDRSPERFELEIALRELRAAGRVEDPRCVKVLDLFVDPSQQAPVLLSEYVPGCDLRALISRLSGGREDAAFLTGLSALLIFEQLMLGLAAAHAKGLIHQDLKPENFLVTQDFLEALAAHPGEDALDELLLAWRERPWIKLADWGLAILGKEDLSASITASIASGAIADSQRGGTLVYMAPEQLEGRGISRRSDLFAMGLILYELLTGRPALEARRYAEGLTEEILQRPTELLGVLISTKAASAIDPDKDPALSGLNPELLSLLVGLGQRLKSRRISGEEGMRRVTALIDGSSSGGLTARASRAKAFPWLAVGLVGLALLGLEVARRSGGSKPEGLGAAGRTPLIGVTPAVIDLKIEITGERLGGRFIVPENGRLTGRVTGGTGLADINYGSSRAQSQADGFFSLKIGEPESADLRLSVSRGSAPVVHGLRLWTAKDLGRLRLALCDLKAWGQESAAFQDEVIAAVGTRLGSDFRHKETRDYQVGDQRHRIATFEYLPWQLELQLIPGSKVRARWINLIWNSAEINALEALTRQDLSMAELKSQLKLIFDRPFDQRLLLSGLREVNPSLSQEDRGVMNEFLAYFQAEEGSFDARSSRRELVLSVLKKSCDELVRKNIAQRELELLPVLVAKTELTGSVYHRITGETQQEHRGADIHRDRMPGGFRDKLAKADERFRLVNRVEFQYLCAGGPSLTRGWFDDDTLLLERAWMRDNFGEGDHKAEDHLGKGNPFGLIDILGNCQEWAFEDWDYWVEVMEESSVEKPDFATIFQKLGLPNNTGADYSDFAKLAKERSSFLGLGGDVTHWKIFVRPAVIFAPIENFRDATYRLVVEVPKF